MNSQLTALENNFIRDHCANDLWLINWRDLELPYCTIYIVTADNKWPCKIGVSCAPEKRVRSLQTASWRPLHVANCYWAETVGEARRLEQAVHRRLTEQSRWLHGEWFDMRPEAATEIVEFVSMVEGVDISADIPCAESAEIVRRNKELHHDPKKALELRHKKMMSYG